jgi:2'-5' RNA ligase
MIRLFVALALPAPIKRSLAPLARGLGDVHWLLPEQQHLTLRFIGELDNGRVNEVADALSLVPGLPFELRLKGLGHFPPRGEPRVLWAGVEKSAELHGLKRRIDRALKQIGLAPEARKYSPHVTLARLRRPPPQAGLATWLMRHALYRSEPFPVSSFQLYSSWLRDEGADYVVEASYELVPGAEDWAGDGF